MKKMDSPLDAYKNGAGAPYKMKGHTLPGIKQSKESKTMRAASAPFQQKTIHGKLTKKIEHKRPQAHGELRSFIDPNISKLKKGVQAGGKVGGAKKVDKGQIKRSGGVDYSKTIKDTLMKGYKKLKSMKLGGGKFAG